MPASRTWRAASTSRAPRSASGSLPAWPACRHSPRARSWRPARSSRRICSSTACRRASPLSQAASRAALAGALVGGAFIRLPRAGFAAATWIVSWLVALAVLSVTWLLGGAQGTVVSGGPTTAGHYELALGLTALAVLGFAALAHVAVRARPRGRPRARAGRGRTRRAVSPLAHDRRARRRPPSPALAGALAVQLAGVADPASYGPYLSFKLFVDGAGRRRPRAGRGRRGAAVLGVLSVAADAIGSLENVSATRAHELLDGDHAARRRLARLGRADPARAKRRRFGAGSAPERPAGRGARGERARQALRRARRRGRRLRRRRSRGP